MRPLGNTAVTVDGRWCCGGTGGEVGAVMAGTGQSQRPCWLKAGIALAAGDTRGTEAQLLLDNVLAQLLQILAFTVCLSLTHLGIY